MSRIMRKPAFCICENKDADQLRGNQLISAFVFATRIVQSLFYLNPKFHASTLLTPSIENHPFANHLVLKHTHTNMILSPFCSPKVVKSATKILKIGS